MENKLEVNQKLLTQEVYETRVEEMNGRKHIVVPVVMMVEGVHNGSHGVVYHSEEELSRVPESWNGVPVTIQHPRNSDGDYVSANAPSVLQEYAVGKIFNAYYENGLKAEAWIDEQRLIALSPTAYDHIVNHRPLDVSIGAIPDEIAQQGVWNNEQYEAIAVNLRPDHLALLPGGTGACSWNDGCGVRVNKEGGTQVNLVKLMKGEEEFEVRHDVQANEVGIRTTLQNLQSLLDGMDNDMKMHYLVEMYDNNVIYEVRKSGQGSALYKQSYSVNEDETVDLTGEPVQVRRKVDYIALEESKKDSSSTKKEKQINNNTNEKEVEMTRKSDCAGCMEKVIALINNENTAFTKDDREWLLTQDEAVLDKLFPKEVKEEKPVVNTETAIEALSAEDKAALEYGKQQLKAHRDGMIQSIQANTEEGVWTVEVLNNMDNDTLQRIAKSVKKEEEPANYSLNGGRAPQIQNNAGEVEPLYPTGVEIAEVK